MASCEKKKKALSRQKAYGKEEGFVLPLVWVFKKIVSGG